MIASAADTRVVGGTTEAAYAVLVATATKTQRSVDHGTADHYSRANLERFVIAACMTIGVRPLRGTDYSAAMSALLLGGLVFLAVDGLRSGWLFATARRVDQLVWVAIAWAIAVVAVTGPGAELSSIMVSFVFGTLLALRIGACLRPSETVALSMVAIVVVSLVLSPLQVADSTLGTTWAFEHKNAAGRVLGLAVVVLLGRRVTNPEGRFGSVFLFTGLVALAMTWKTNSGTVLLAISVALAFLWFNRRVRPQRAAKFATPIVVIASGLIVIALAVLVFGIMHVDPAATISALLGRSTTDNTALVRLSLWSDAVKQIAARPLLGYGYTPYDRGDLVFSSGTQVARDFDPTNLHNGYLQLAFSFGIAFCLIAIGHTFRRIWQNYQAGLPLRTAIALCIGIYGLSYSVLFAGPQRASLFWALSFWAIYIVPASLNDGPHHELTAHEGTDNHAETDLGHRTRSLTARRAATSHDDALRGLDAADYESADYDDVDLVVDESTSSLPDETPAASARDIGTPDISAPDVSAPDISATQDVMGFERDAR